MAQDNLPANSHFLSTAAPKEDHNVNSTRNGAQSTTINTDWDVWLPMLPPLDELPWTLQDISKVLRLGRTREKFRAITPQAVERVSFLLQRPLLRIVLEARRLSILHSKCSRHEMQTSIRLVLSLSLAKSCLSLASKALSLYNTSSDRFRRSKRTRSGLILPVGKMFRWLVKIKVASRIYDAGVIYLSACLEYVAEELVYRAVTKQEGLDQVTPEVLEEWINTDADFWGIFQPYYHLLSGRTAFGITDSIDVYAVSKNVKSSPSTGSSIRQGLDKALATTCVTSMNDLRDLVLRAQELFAGVYQSKDNKFISQVDWIPSALHTLFYFVKYLQQVGEDTSDILTATRRSHSHLPPLVEWLKVSSLHTKHRVSAFVDDDDVRQAARLLLPFNDCGPRFLGESLWGSKSLSSAATISSFQQDVSLRMLSCGRSDIIPQALAMLGSKNINDINAQGMTLLMYACANGNEALVTTLIEHHASLDLQVPNNQQIYPSLNLELKSWTALCFATTKGHHSICQILLDSGASPNGATDFRRDNQVETPLQLASAAGDFELVSLLLKKGADPYISVNTASLSPGLRGFGNAFAAAAAHGHKEILRKLLAESDERRDTDLLSLTEILYEETLKDEERPGKLTKRQKAALEEALYHSCEHGYLDITMELRSLGVPWNIHCWSRTVGHAYETGQKSFLRSLLSDFQSMSADEYTNDFCDDGVVILFNIFKECEDLALSKELASVLSCCFGSEPLQEIMDLPVMETGIRIGADYINSAEMSDVTFLVEGRPFYAHKIILATASKRFKAMLSDMPLESKDGSSPCIEISDIKYETFTLVIQFLYSGKMDQPSLQSTILELLQASEFFMLDSLKRRCERLAADHLVCETVLDTYTFAKLCNAKELVSFCEAFMLRNLASMMDVRTFKDALIDNSGKDLFAALKSCLVQRIYSQKTPKTSFKV